MSSVLPSINDATSILVPYYYALIDHPSRRVKEDAMIRSHSARPQEMQALFRRKHDLITCRRL
jgi:hypothetical protein